MSNLAYTIPPLVVTVIGGISVVFVFFIGLRNLVSRIFALFLLSMSLWGLFLFLMRVSPDTESALIWSRIIFLMGFAQYIFFYHFTCLYTHRGNRVLTVIAYISLLAVSIISPIGLLVSHVTRESYGYAPHAVIPAISVIFLLGFILLILGLINLIKAYRNLTNYEEKNALRYMIIGIILLMVFGVLDLLPSFPPMSIYGNLMFIILTMVAILRYHLLDIYVPMRQGTAYFLFIVGVSVPFIGVILLFSNRLEGVAYIGSVIIVFILIIVTLQPLWRNVQSIVDKMFYRERYGFLKELEKFSQEYHDISDLKGLSSSLGNILGRALQTTNVYILTLTDSGDYETIYATDEKSEPIILHRNHPVISWARENTGIVAFREFDVIPRLLLVNSRDKNKFTELKVELFVPLKTKKDELVGMFVLCEKTSGQPFSGEDVQLILTVADRISVELENARLYATEIEVRKQLEAQNEEKIEFLHQVAHEMKTPLTSLIASSDLLIENLSSGDDINRRLVTNIQRSADSMDKRVTELLFSAGLEGPNIEIKIETLDLTEVIDSVLGQSRFLFTEKEQTLKVEFADNLPKVKADRSRLEQILTNILSNANKFSASGSEIGLRTRVDGNDVVIEVEDEAEKITREDEKRLFEPYFRSENIDKRSNYPGLGLGLAITKRLLEMQNGRIWINRSSKKGNIFAFSLPVAD